MFIPFVAAMSHGRFLLLTIIITLLILSNSPTAVLQRRTKVPTPVLSPSLRLFPLTQTLRALSLPPFLWRGVVFRSAPATRGRPRWPTEGGRNWTPTLCRRSSMSMEDYLFQEKLQGGTRQKKSLPARGVSIVFFCLLNVVAQTGSRYSTCHIATDGPSK